jgi:hypothetical protein
MLSETVKRSERNDHVDVATICRVGLGLWFMKSASITICLLAYFCSCSDGTHRSYRSHYHKSVCVVDTVFFELSYTKII